MRGIVCPPRTPRALFVTIALAACSFPDVTFAPADGGDADTIASGPSSGSLGSTGSGAEPDATQGASGRSTRGDSATGSGAGTGTVSGSGGSVSGGSGTSTGSGGSGSGVTGSGGAGSGVAATDSAAAQDTSSAADQAAPPEASTCETACMAPKDATAPADSMGPVDAETHDAAASDDKATVDDPVVEATMDAPTCDFDHDGYLAGADVSTCGGNDCDDTDARANPGIVGFQYWLPLGKMNGDWNCNGMVEKEFKANINCSSLLNVQCDTIQGFTGDDPGCSMLGIFVQCTSALVGLNCMDGPAQHVRQGCM